MPKVTVSLDVNLVLDVMVLSGIRNAQDAVEVVVRDYVERGQRTEARTGDAVDQQRTLDQKPRFPDG